MCGICGDVRRPCGGLPDERALRAMCGARRIAALMAKACGAKGNGVWGTVG